MLAEKKLFTAEDLGFQVALDLPDRVMICWSLVYVSVQTGDINVLSYNDFDSCLQAQNLLLAKGHKLLQKCRQTL
jgi:hypothetical protein